MSRKKKRNLLYFLHQDVAASSQQCWYSNVLRRLSAVAAALKQERLCKFHPERILCDVLDHLPGGLRPVKQRLKLLREKGQLKFSLRHTSSGKAHVKYFSLITDVISGYKFPNSRELRGDTIGWLRNKWVHFLCNYKCRLLWLYIIKIRHKQVSLHHFMTLGPYKCCTLGL